MLDSFRLPCYFCLMSGLSLVNRLVYGLSLVGAAFFLLEAEDNWTQAIVAFGLAIIASLIYLLIASFDKYVNRDK